MFILFFSLLTLISCGQNHQNPLIGNTPDNNLKAVSLALEAEVKKNNQELSFNQKVEKIRNEANSNNTFSKTYYQDLINKTLKYLKNKDYEKAWIYFDLTNAHLEDAALRDTLPIKDLQSLLIKRHQLLTRKFEKLEIVPSMTEINAYTQMCSTFFKQENNSYYDLIGVLNGFHDSPNSSAYFYKTIVEYEHQWKMLAKKKKGNLKDLKKLTAKHVELMKLLEKTTPKKIKTTTYQFAPGIYTLEKNIKLKSVDSSIYARIQSKGSKKIILTAKTLTGYLWIDISTKNGKDTPRPERPKGLKCGLKKLPQAPAGKDAPSSIRLYISIPKITGEILFTGIAGNGGKGSPGYLAERRVVDCSYPRLEKKCHVRLRGGLRTGGREMGEICKREMVMETYQTIPAGLAGPKGKSSIMHPPILLRLKNKKRFQSYFIFNQDGTLAL